MTREEAIKRLENIDIRDALQEDYDALHIAIKALEHPERNVVAVVPCGDTISRQAVLDELNKWDWQELYLPIHFKENIIDVVPSVNPQEQKTGWNNHQIACMLADLFGDACACNYNGIDEWLGELCDFKDTCCPNPVGVACWEQFLKYSQSRYTECGYEVRDKNALQEPKTDTWSIKEVADALARHLPVVTPQPKTGHWTVGHDEQGEIISCGNCGRVFPTMEPYCGNCGYRMLKPVKEEET